MKTAHGGSNVGFNARAYMQPHELRLHTKVDAPDGGFRLLCTCLIQGRNDIENSFRRPVVDLAGYYRTR
ncbi:hypothetical protein EMIT0324P_11682 [Pseudomonas chlororaphis]